MPVSFLQIKHQVRQMGERAVQLDASMRIQHTQAQELLETHANQLSQLRERVERASQTNPHLRCAIPLNEALTFTAPLPSLSGPYVLLAADGSQINPDHHAQVEFGVVNAGAIRMEPGRNLVPQETVVSKLLFDEDLYLTNGGTISEEIVALKRDLAERKLLAEMAAIETKPVVALTDGPLELFREPKQGPEFKRDFDEYLRALRQLAGLHTATAGYVDKPRADLVVRLLELAMLPEDQLDKAGRERTLRYVKDSDLFFNRLAPGERSPVFGIQSESAHYFKLELELHFFYINVGRLDKPWLARVEIPAWVANEKQVLDRLHAALVEQCLQMGSRPYPYVIHRAHEVAVVSREEQQQVQEMIAIEMRRRGLQVADFSNKQFAKDNSGKRTRYPS
jgi:hypothetical protein